MSDLSHGRMVNAVAGQGGAKLSAGLITPLELREQLTRIRDEKVLVVKVVDDGYPRIFLNRVRDVVGANPILRAHQSRPPPRGTDLDAPRVGRERRTRSTQPHLVGVCAAAAGSHSARGGGRRFAERKGPGRTRVPRPRPTSAAPRPPAPRLCQMREGGTTVS